jgi:hypothetical protein
MLARRDHAGSMEVPILSSMEAVEIGRMSWGFPVHVDKHAYEADHIVLVNRIKPHTNYRAHVESGLMKMLVIGLGKHQGAILAHRASVDVGLPRAIPEVARFSLSKLPILFGVGSLENVRHQTAKVEATLPEALRSPRPGCSRRPGRSSAGSPSSFFTS